VAEFPTKENENVPYQNEGLLKRKEAGNNGDNSEEFSLGFFEQDKQIKGKTQQQPQQNHNYFIDQHA